MANCMPSVVSLNPRSTYTRNIRVILLFLFWLVSYAVGTGEITGFRVEDTPVSNGWSEVRKGRAFIYADYDVTIRIYGRSLKSGGEIAFATSPADRLTSCQDLRVTEIFELQAENDESGLVTINLRLLRKPDEFYLFCFRDKNVTTSGNTEFVHQGSKTWLQLGTAVAPEQHNILPVWILIIIVSLLLIVSGMFSGLNLGLMSLDNTELQILINSGTTKEREYAKIIRPVRRQGNFLLCTILLGNVLINNTMAILLEDLTGSGVAAVVGATLGIVIVGEIIPQAICTRYGLAVGARTIWFTKFFMFLTFPLSYPISKILDCILGEEIGHVYNRDRLRELIHLTEKQTDLRKEEVNIITGALELSRKTVDDIMTKLEDVFMIEISSLLDFETMNMIMKNGYSRVPVYEKNKKNIVGLLNIRDLAFVDPDDRMPLRTVLKFYNHPVIFVFQDTPLDVMLQDFKKGHSHLAVVQRVDNEGYKDPYYEPIGLVTLEDIIEEIIQAEIVDETDIISDNRKRLPRNTFQKDFSIFSQPEADNYPRLSPQLALATYQFLSTSVPPFRPDVISETVLQKLIRQNVVINLHLGDIQSVDYSIVTAGKPCDFFAMILQGHVEVEYVKDAIRFEGGPFTFFGVQALQDLMNSASAHESMQSITSINLSSRRQSFVSFMPDFTVRPLTDLQFIRITRAQYIVAANATLMERRPKSPPVSNSVNNFSMAWAQYQQQRSLEALPSDMDFIKERGNSSQSLATNVVAQDKSIERERNSLKMPGVTMTPRRLSVSFAPDTQPAENHVD